MTDQLVEFSNENGCPKCGSESVSPVRYTWWGGLLGPKILNHTKCQACNYTYNSKTRKSNTAGIVIYFVVFVGLAGLVFYFLRKS